MCSFYVCLISCNAHFIYSSYFWGRYLENESRSTERFRPLEAGKVYRLLVILKYEVNGNVQGSSPMKSIRITSVPSGISSKLILVRN